ncbi:hypothetical protein F5X68DRAFT_198046 [Plectosphaerella plurivora]|uniref:Uncharacterized protein n=1 Tax=Plectosphaerella plurivora TaxID=936078 RepID=A0A9P8VIJ9_9PEZI|nr:hypothetical protein F5X68DRAFT_198046 [Plectosphaerella plurivora]
MRFQLSFLLQATASLAQLTSSMLEKHVDSVTLGSSFNPIQESYWTGYPHHRRTPFAVSPDGTSGYLAYLDASGTGVHIQPVDPKTFASKGTPVTVAGAKEAGGLVAHDDGFALLTNEPLAAGTANAPGTTPVPVLYRYTDGKQTWKTFLGGPSVTTSAGFVASPDLNGDLVFSEKAGYYAAYFVVTSYSGGFSGHFGDAIRYVTPAGKIEQINGASSDWGCSHNTGIAFEAADAAPFASLCAEDQGAIWLNTKTQGMGNNGVKVSNEVTINGGSNEPMGGMGGSYSSLSRFTAKDSYIFSWVSRGAVDLTLNDWMGNGYTKSKPRTTNRNVAIALFSDKNTLVGDQAISTVGAASGDDQINWITSGSADHSNAHVAAFSGDAALVTYEEIASPSCTFDAMGCQGVFTGTYYQLVDGTGKKVGEPVKSMDSFVAGDMVTMGDGRICWPYINMDWRLDGTVRSLPKTTATKVSFACIDLGGAGSVTPPAEEPVNSTPAAAPVASSSAAAAAPPSSSAAAAPATTPAAEVPVPAPTAVDVEEVPASSAPVAVASSALPVGGSTDEDTTAPASSAAPITPPAASSEPAAVPAPSQAAPSSAAPLPTTSAKVCPPRTRRTVTQTVYVTRA